MSDDRELARQFATEYVKENGPEFIYCDVEGNGDLVAAAAELRRDGYLSLLCWDHAEHVLVDDQEVELDLCLPFLDTAGPKVVFRPGVKVRCVRELRSVRGPWWFLALVSGASWDGWIPCWSKTEPKVDPPMEKQEKG